MWKLRQHTPEQTLNQRRNQKGNLKSLETNENGNTTYQNLQDAAKVVLRERIIMINAYIKKKKNLK